MKGVLQFILEDSREQICSQAKQYSRGLVVLKLEPNVTAPALMFMSWSAYQIAFSFSEVFTPGNKIHKFFQQNKCFNLSLGIIRSNLLR